MHGRLSPRMPSDYYTWLTIEGLHGEGQPEANHLHSGGVNKALHVVYTHVALYIILW